MAYCRLAMALIALMVLLPACGSLPLTKDKILPDARMGTIKAGISGRDDHTSEGSLGGLRNSLENLGKRSRGGLRGSKAPSRVVDPNWPPPIDETPFGDQSGPSGHRGMGVPSGHKALDDPSGVSDIGKTPVVEWSALTTIFRSLRSSGPG